MPRATWLRSAYLAALSLLMISSTRAADVFYRGTWKIVSAEVAPWWTEQTKELIGKTVIFTAKSIAGPRAAACRDPRYKVRDYPAYYLFQGLFGEMHDRDKSVDPVKVAASVGFHGSKWKTLETGCATELDFHFIDPTTAAFGLNNYIYKMKKQPSDTHLVAP